MQAVPAPLFRPGTACTQGTKSSDQRPRPKSTVHNKENVGLTHESNAFGSAAVLSVLLGITAPAYAGQEHGGYNGYRIPDDRFRVSF